MYNAISYYNDLLHSGIKTHYFKAVCLQFTASYTLEITGTTAFFPLVKHDIIGKLFQN